MLWWGRFAGRGLLITADLLLLAFLVGLMFPVPTLAPKVPPAQRLSTGGLPWLSVHSGQIVDEAGRTMLLRGYNVDALVDYPDHPAAPLDEQDATAMQAVGADVVRLPITWSQLEPVRGRIDQRYLDRIVAAVEMLNRHHLYVVPNMHFYPNWGPAYGGVGAPGWATFSGFPDPAWSRNDLVRKNLSPGANVSATYFWGSEDWQRDYLMAWRAVAVRLRDMPGVAGYDLYNEPRPGPMPPPLFEKYWYWPLMARNIEAVGTVDPNHLFIVEGTLFVDLPTSMASIHAPDLVYSPHFYTGSLVPPAFDGDRSAIEAEMRERAGEAAEISAPLWVGELGDDHRMATGAQWADAVLDAADDRGLGWAWWQWRQLWGGWWMRSFDGKTYDLTMLHQVARPYLAAAPDGVRGGRGDGVRGRLAITVSPVHANSAVEVAWPAMTLPAPAAGGPCLADMSWDPAASRLHLRLAAGQGCTIEVGVGD